MPRPAALRSAPDVFPAWWKDKSGKMVAGYIDARGEVVFESGFALCHPFREGRAHCIAGRDLIYLGEDFREVARFPNSFGWSFRAGYATVSRRIDEHRSASGLIDRAGRVVVDFRFRDVGTIVEDCYYGCPLEDNPHHRVFLYDRQGGILAADVAISAGKEGVSEGLARSFSEDPSFGYRDPRGQWVIPPRYADAHPFRDGRAAVSQREKGHFRWWFIDRAGEVALADPRWRSVPADFAEGFAAVARTLKGNRCGIAFIARDGTPLTDYEFTGAGPFADGLAPVADAAGRWGYLDRQGRLAIACRFAEARPFQGALARVQLEERYHYIDRTGEIVHSLPEYFLGDLQFSLSD